MNRIWKFLWGFDRPPKTGGERKMLVFIGESIYFILALSGNYEEAIYMSDFASVMVLGLLMIYMSSLVVWEGEHLRPVYQKILYFPVDRKKYLLSKAASAAAVTGFQIGITGLVFLCRILIGRAVAGKVMLWITLCMALSGVWSFLILLALLVLGERALNLFPLSFISVYGSHLLYRFLSGFEMGALIP